jgi:DNA-binding NarL/FixJ family response regulator
VTTAERTVVVAADRTGDVERAGATATIVDMEQDPVAALQFCLALRNEQPHLSMQLQLSAVDFERMLNTLAPRDSPRRGPAGQAYVQRALEVIALVAHGLSDREIGARLHLSRHTVHHKIERLRDDLGLKNRIELAAWAGRHGLYVVAAES